MITFPLKTEWFDKIESGVKTIEYREYKEYWIKRILIQGSELQKNKNGCLVLNTHKQCVFRKGYTKNILYADISKIEIWDKRENDLHSGKVFAIHLENVRRTL